MGVKFEKVTKAFVGARPAVDDLSLEVQSGELLVLIGPSGCGKTTTLRMINRLENPTSGTIYIDGRDVRSYDPIQLRRGIGYTIQQTGLLPHMTVEQNIELVPRLLKWDKKRRHQRTRELLEMVGMDYTSFAHRYPRQLSGGQQQRIGVLRALATDPPVILMDEPFGALDPISREALQTELKRLQQKLQKTIVFVTHDIDEALRLGDRIAILREGKLVQVDTPERLLKEPQDEFVAQFLGRFMAPVKVFVNNAQQFIHEGALHISHKLSAHEQIMQVADVPLWCRVDETGVLKAIALQKPEDTSQWESVPWVAGDAVSVSETDSSHEVLKRLLDRETDALPVVDRERHLVGVVTHRSAIKALSHVIERS